MYTRSSSRRLIVVRFILLGRIITRVVAITLALMLLLLLLLFVLRRLSRREQTSQWDLARLADCMVASGRRRCHGFGQARCTGADSAIANIAATIRRGAGARSRGGRL